MSHKHRLLQRNLNRSREAQDLFLHHLAEGGYTVGIATEPNHVQANHSSWAGVLGDSVAITWQWKPGRWPCFPVKRARRHVAIV